MYRIINKLLLSFTRELTDYRSLTLLGAVKPCRYNADYNMAAIVRNGERSSIV